MTFEIIEHGRAIKCLVCGMTSWHPVDVEKRYCGNCHRFHADGDQGRGLSRWDRGDTLDGGVDAGA